MMLRRDSAVFPAVCAPILSIKKKRERISSSPSITLFIIIIIIIIVIIIVRESAPQASRKKPARVSRGEIDFNQRLI